MRLGVAGRPRRQGPGRYDAARVGGVARIVVPVLAAMAGFVVVAEATLPRVPLPEDADVEARFEHLARDTEGYEVVALGASTVMRAFDPGAFDRELAARGHPMRSPSTSACPAPSNSRSIT
jgi:hypothetical protein